jgi:hypothetical protein
MMRAVWILLPIFVFAAAEARAESPVALSAVRYEADAPAPVIRMPGEAQSGGQASGLFLPAADRDAAPALPEGVAKTSVDHRFSPSGDVMGSLGYLCGMAKTPLGSGSLASSYEPAGTFLGGQLKVAF